MNQSINRQVRLKARPSGIPHEEHFEIVETSIPRLSDRQILIRNIFLSVEPAMRGWVSSVANYAEPVPLDGVMRALAVGQVVEPRDPEFKAGDYVTGMFGWQGYFVADASTIQRKVNADKLPISTSLGVLGLNGMTAYFGLLEVGQPTSGDTVVVSTAAGAVGSCVGQIAKIKQCRTVGITGGPEKVQLCQEAFQYDLAIDYRSEGLDEKLTAACPNGIDVYFDNTSGAISDTVLKHLNVGARVVICGTASIDSWEPIPLGPRVERHLIVNRARMQGFLIFDYQDRYAEAVDALTEWVEADLIHYREDILEGIEQAPGAIAGLYRGENLGKRLIKIADI